MNRVSRMVMETQFEERRRYSGELHDRPAHQMTVVAQSLDLYRAFRKVEPERAERKARRRQGIGPRVARPYARVLQGAKALRDDGQVPPVKHLQEDRS